MTTLYWDCFSGIAGNMAVASLLDLGANRQKLLEGLKSINFTEGQIELIIEERLVDGIRGLYFNTADDEHEHYHHYDDHGHSGHSHCHEHHDHDHGHDHEHEHAHAHTHCHSDNDHHHEHNDSHEHSHGRSGHGHGQHGHAQHRGLKEITTMIEAAVISPRAREIAISCFRELAEAEATVHGKSIDEVHFHEVGARDSIADIVGAAICLDDLNVREVIVSPVHLGSGMVKCAHGIMPVPAPATALLLKGFSVVFDHDVTFELTTPTGAALLRGMKARAATGTQTFTKVGHGHGSLKTGRANFLRAFLIESETIKKKSDQITQLTSNIDNATGEELGHAISKFMAAGALDACLIPILMKKGRPGHQLQVLAEHAKVAMIENMIFSLLPTIGVRRCNVDRSTLHRECEEADSNFGRIRVKKITKPDGETVTEPEFDEIIRIAEEQNCAPRKIKQRIVV